MILNWNDIDTVLLDMDGTLLDRHFDDHFWREHVELALSGVFVYLHGSKPIVDFLAGALETGNDGCIPVNPMMETSISGVFAAGDVTCTEVRQVVVAASQGCIAALSAEKYLFKRKRYKMDWGK